LLITYEVGLLGKDFGYQRFYRYPTDIKSGFRAPRVNLNIRISGVSAHLQRIDARHADRRTT